MRFEVKGASNQKVTTLTAFVMHRSGRHRRDGKGCATRPLTGQIMAINKGYPMEIQQLGLCPPVEYTNRPLEEALEGFTVAVHSRPSRYGALFGCCDCCRRLLLWP
jgi:hypothetical protein